MTIRGYGGGISHLWAVKINVIKKGVSVFRGYGARRVADTPGDMCAC